MKKKIVALALVFCLSLAIGVGGTLAYLTATTQTVTNTFTVGNVSFDTAALDEADVDVYGVKETVSDGEGGTKDAPRVTANKYKLIPGHTYVKDPTIHIGAGSENAWLFVKVENGISAIEATGDTTIASQMAAKGWAAVPTDSNIYYWPTQVTANQDVVVFESFKLATDAAVANYANASITIQAGIVQAEGFATASAAWTAAGDQLFTTSDPADPAE